MAPEVIEMRQPPTPKSDIWSVGCLTLEIFTGRPPYFNLTPMSALYHICADAAIPIEDPNHNITQVCRLFLQECFQKDPEKRPSAAQLLNHPWFQQSQPQDRVLFEMEPNFASPQSTARKLRGVGGGERSLLASSLSCSLSDSLERRSSLERMSSLERKSSLGSVERSGRSSLVESGRDKSMETRGRDRSAQANPSGRSTQPLNARESPVTLSSSLSKSLLDDQSMREVEEIFESIDVDQMADELSEKTSMQDMEESKILSSLQVVTEASRRHVRAGDLPAALRTLRQAIVEQKQVDAVVRNGGLYPLVSCALVKVKDEETSLLTLQVELERP